MKKFFDRNKYVILTFFIAMLVISFIYTFNHVAPFGNNSLLDVDFYHQYGPLLNELYDRIKSGESLLYSFNTGGGIPFYRNFLNYLSSPFNILLFLFKKENIVMAFSIIIGFKAVCAATSMSYYLKKTFKKDSMLISVFGILYAFSGYFCAYYWNIMWLDGIVFLPIIMLGINKIVEKEKPLLYIFSLALMLFTNYFIGYMICIFSVLYFIGYFIVKGEFKWKEILKKGLIFGISSLLAAGVVAFALLPLYSALSSISATTDAFPNMAFNFSTSNYIFNHLTGVNRTVFASDTVPLPNVYAGVITLVGVVLIFFNNKIKLVPKLIALLVLIFFYLSFNVNVIDFMWHAFHVPNDLPYRYSFIYVFLLISIGYYSIINIKKPESFRVNLSFVIVFFMILLSYKMHFKNLDYKRTIILIVIFLCYYGTYLLSFVKKIPKDLTIFLVCIIAISECTWGISTNWNIDHDIKTFMKNKKPITKLVNYVKEKDNDFYRIDRTNYLTLNDGAWYDYPGISSFSSMAYEDTAKFYRKFGFPGNNINSYYYKEMANPIFNTLFNVKYLIAQDINSDNYNLLSRNKEYGIYKYKYPSSIGYGVNKEIENLNLVDNNPFINQSNFLSLGFGVNDLYEPINIVKTSNVIINNENFYNNSNGEFDYKLENVASSFDLTLYNNKEQNIYLYIGGQYVTGFYVNDYYYDITSDEFYILDTGLLPEGEVNISIKVNSALESYMYFYAYSINQDKFKEFYNKINKDSIKLNSFNDTNFDGDIYLEDDKTLFTTLSYDNGFNVYVDGDKVETKKVAGAFLGFDLDKGKHNIKIKYVPENLYTGIAISVISILLIYYLNKLKKLKKIRNKHKR